MSIVVGILVAAVILVPALVYLGMLIWGAIQDGRIARQRDRGPR
jgi:hypothetical protein